MLSYSYIINCVCYYDGLFTIIYIKRGTQKKINVQKKKKGLMTYFMCLREHILLCYRV